MKEKMIKQAVKRYDETFKIEAVQLTMRPGAKLKAIAQDLGVSPVSLRGWRDRIVGSANAPTGLRPEDLALRVRQLEQDLSLVKEERDILKNMERGHVSIFNI